MISVATDPSCSADLCVAAWPSACHCLWVWRQGVRCCAMSWKLEGFQVTFEKRNSGFNDSLLTIKTGSWQKVCLFQVRRKQVITESCCEKESVKISEWMEKCAFVTVTAHYLVTWHGRVVLFRARSLWLRTVPTAINDTKIQFKQVKEKQIIKHKNHKCFLSEDNKQGTNAALHLHLHLRRDHSLALIWRRIVSNIPPNTKCMFHGEEYITYTVKGLRQQALLSTPCNKFLPQNEENDLDRIRI